jgi:hypothetical protein
LGRRRNGLQRTHRKNETIHSGGTRCGGLGGTFGASAAPINGSILGATVPAPELHKAYNYRQACRGYYSGRHNYRGYYDCRGYRYYYGVYPSYYYGYPGNFYRRYWYPGYSRYWW